MSLFFNWIRTSVRNAVLGGVQDALDHLDTSSSAVTAPALTVTLSLPALPKPEQEEKPARGRK